MTAELILAIVGFLILAVLAIFSIVDGVEIRRLKKVLNELYMQVAEDRIDLHKELGNVREDYKVTQFELDLLASRCNQCEKSGCVNHVEKTKEVTTSKAKRPRLPKK